MIFRYLVAANRAPGDSHWAPHQPYTATPAGFTRGFGFKPCREMGY